MPMVDYGKYFETDDARPAKAWCDEAFVYAVLADGREIKTPLWWYPWLKSASAQDRSEVELELFGIWWPKIDEGISVKSMLLGWKAPRAIESCEAPEQAVMLSVGQPLPPTSETEKNAFPDGVHSPPDYRSLIHERIHRSYEFGRRYLASFDYDRFFAATDTMLDTVNVLHLARTSRWPKSETVGYLWLYGALQALFVYQDACRQLLECFGLKRDPSNENIYREVHELRIAAVGHPSNHGNKALDVQGCTYLGHQDSNNPSRFHIVTLRDFQKSVHRVIDIPALAAKQRGAVEFDLARVWNLIHEDPKYDPPPFEDNWKSA